MHHTTSKNTCKDILDQLAPPQSHGNLSLVISIYEKEGRRIGVPRPPFGTILIARVLNIKCAVLTLPWLGYHPRPGFRANTHCILCMYLLVYETKS